MNALAPPPLFAHQAQTAALLDRESRVFDMSDPGTGKTRAALDSITRRRKAGGGKTLILAPKSILQVAWGDDIDKFFPGVKYSIARAENRIEAFETDADIYVTNHDAVTWLLKNLKPRHWDDFETIVFDESTAFKNASSQRSKSLRKLSKYFSHREAMSGTPNPNTVLELWHQVLLLDEGSRLGPSFYQFRNAVCQPVQIGPGANHIEWRDKPGAEEAVFDLISDISIRHRFEDCVDIPEHHTYEIFFDMPRSLRRQYTQMLDEAYALLDNGKLVSAVHAAATNEKLLQIASGAVYAGDGTYHVLDTSRTELILDLIEQRRQCVVPFIWTHQRDQLVAGAKARDLEFRVIDGSVTRTGFREEAVNEFQAGNVRVLFIHPKSAGHGLTLTKGTSLIWASPTYNSEHYKQVKHRIYRTGQEESTETIHVVARNSVEERVYSRLGAKLSAMQLFLDLMEKAA